MPFGLETSTLPLSHCAPFLKSLKPFIKLTLVLACQINFITELYALDISLWMNGSLMLESLHIGTDYVIIQYRSLGDLYNLLYHVFFRY